MPSISFNNVDNTLDSTFEEEEEEESLLFLSVTIASSSSINNTHGLACLAMRNAFLISASASPIFYTYAYVCR